MCPPGTPRPMPTWRRVPTCGRNSRGTRTARRDRQTPARPCAGRSGPFGKGNGPSRPTISANRPAARVSRLVTAITSCHCSPPNPFTRCGVAEPRVKAPTMTPQGGPALDAEPGGHRLHRRGIDPGQEQPGQAAQGDRHGDIRRGEQQGVAGRRAGGAIQHEPARCDQIGQVEGRRPKRANHESELYGNGQPRRLT